MFKGMPTRFVGPVGVVFANILHPIRFADGRLLYRVQVEGGERFYAVEMPKLRDSEHRPLDLREEIARGSDIRLALDDDDLIRAIQVVNACYDDPFAEAESE